MNSLTLVESGKINNTAAKEVLEEMVNNLSEKTPEEIIKGKGVNSRKFWWKKNQTYCGKKF